MLSLPEIERADLELRAGFSECYVGRERTGDGGVVKGDFRARELFLREGLHHLQAFGRFVLPIQREGAGGGKLRAVRLRRIHFFRELKGQRD